MSPWELFVPLLIAFLLATAHWQLFEKLGLPGWGALIPGWNVVLVLKVLGRPASEGWFLLVPGWNVLWLCMLMFELSDGFGRSHWTDKALALVFLAFYTASLGLDEGASFQGVERERT